MKTSPWIRTALSSLFILLMLASAHLLMVVINHVEARVAHPVPDQGQPARMFSDRPLAEELEMTLAKARNPGDQHTLEQALAAVRAGEPVTLNTLPVTPFLAHATLILCALGVLLLMLSVRIKSDAAQTIVGVFAGNLLWTGGVEYGLTIAARSLGIAKAVGVVDGQLVAIYGEYVLLKHSWGAIALVVVYLLFLESSRCPIFLWWRERVPTMRGALVTGRIDNYAPRTAFQYSTTVWAFYLLLLWAYDEHLFGVYSAFTYGTLFLSIAGGMYCMMRLHQQPSWGTSIRYAVGAMVVVWTPVEIFAKWGLMKEPWLLLRPSTLVVFFGGLALGTFLLWRMQRRNRPAPAPALAKGPLALTHPG